MTPDIAAILLQDGIANGAIYILLAVVLVLVFTVTRIVFIPQGDLVAFSALTLAAFEAGTMPARSGSWPAAQRWRSCWN